jgi:phosphoribosylaminoimidazole carboxylase (NCAIR synthetase)
MSAPLPPGSAIGIVGGGQLGRMSAMAAARLGYHCHIFATEPDGPASQVAAHTTIGAYDDLDCLRRFGRSVAAVTFEFENVSAAGLEKKPFSDTPAPPSAPGVTSMIAPGWTRRSRNSDCPAC